MIQITVYFTVYFSNMTQCIKTGGWEGDTLLQKIKLKAEKMKKRGGIVLTQECHHQFLHHLTLVHIRSRQ
jgi:hypothetical protein